jgi:hypothetical protein
MACKHCEQAPLGVCEECSGGERSALTVAGRMSVSGSVSAWGWCAMGSALSPTHQSPTSQWVPLPSGCLARVSVSRSELRVRVFHGTGC